MSQSRWQDIYLKLKQKGIAAYSPAQKEGECISPYTVIRDASTSKFLTYSSTRTYYDLMCYVPKESFSTLEPYVEKVKEAMKELYPMISPTYTQTASFYDDTVKGHMVSVQYYNYRKI